MWSKQKQHQASCSPAQTQLLYETPGAPSTGLKTCLVFVTDKKKIVIAQCWVVSAQKELSLAGLAKAYFLMKVTDGGGSRRLGSSFVRIL